MLLGLVWGVAGKDFLEYARALEASQRVSEATR